MTIFPALIHISDDSDEPFIIHHRIGGQPTLIVPTLARALAVGRRGLTAPEFVARICAAIGINSIRNTSVMPDKYDSNAIAFEYRIDLATRRPHVTVTAYSDDYPPEIRYDGHLDNYLTKELRKPSRRRGRPPSGYSSMQEFQQDVERPRRHENLTQEVLNERAQADNPHVDLKGVRVFSHDEWHAKRKARKLGPAGSSEKK